MLGYSFFFLRILAIKKSHRFIIPETIYKTQQLIENLY